MLFDCSAVTPHHHAVVTQLTALTPASYFVLSWLELKHEVKRTVVCINTPDKVLIIGVMK